MADDPYESLRIVQPLGKGFGGTQVVEELRLFAEWEQGIMQVSTQVNGLFERIATFGEMRQGSQCLLKTRHGFAVRRTGGRSGPGLTAVGQSLLPHLAPYSMVGQAVHLLTQSIREKRF
jgi:hypothetical protein